MATVGHVACELLLSFVVSFTLTWALLPVLGLQAAPLAVLRVTGFFTVVVFTSVDGMLEVFLRRSEKDVEEKVEGSENPQFKLQPRVMWDAELGGAKTRKACYDSWCAILLRRCGPI
ncbi:hypothetical protein FB45DRAFT_923221 [Roridomyces roridus]|uniref:Uncharacterized protein n=1 Tax=Roridomyces roridus TaxID=1738132 RepID=A0AAD7BLJ9_9AGAR|nr:hypothetical protein FB45DRAFT_923221 [Roridomyces roridus]